MKARFHRHNRVLWAIRIDGPDEIHAAAGWLAAHLAAWRFNRWAKERVARVVHWPFDPDCHAANLLIGEITRKQNKKRIANPAAPNAGSGKRKEKYNETERQMEQIEEKPKMVAWIRLQR